MNLIPTKKLLAMTYGIAIICLFVGLLAYRQNALNEIDLETKLLQADQASQDTAPALAELKAYVASHMHTSTTISLTNTYSKSVAEYNASVTPPPADQATADLYAAAQAACNSRASSVTQANCVRDYVDSRKVSTPDAQPTATPKAVPKATDFTYNLVSPWWSFDLAGIFLALGLITFVISIGLTIQLFRAPKRSSL